VLGKKQGAQQRATCGHPLRRSCLRVWSCQASQPRRRRRPHRCTRIHSRSRSCYRRRRRGPQYRWWGWRRDRLHRLRRRRRASRDEGGGIGAWPRRCSARTKRRWRWANAGRLRWSCTTTTTRTCRGRACCARARRRPIRCCPQGRPFRTPTSRRRRWARGRRARARCTRSAAPRAPTPRTALGAWASRPAARRGRTTPAPSAPA
jgi:hypothetical protein